MDPQFMETVRSPLCGPAETLKRRGAFCLSGWRVVGAVGVSVVTNAMVACS